MRENSDKNEEITIYFEYNPDSTEEESTSARNRTSASNRTAILLLDFQNEFAKKGGKLHKQVSQVMDETGMLHKVVDLVNAARKMGCVVIYAPVVMKASEGMSVPRRKSIVSPQRSYFQQAGFFTENTWNCDFIHELEPTGDDFILTDRSDFNAFAGTKLDSIIESNKIKHFFITGFLTDVCVYETAKAASEMLPDVSTYVISDGCAAQSSSIHHNALDENIPKYANVLTCEKAKSQLSLYSTENNFGDEWLLIEKVFAAAGANHDETLDIQKLLSLLRNGISNSQLYSILNDTVRRKNIEGEVSREELYKILFKRKQRKTCLEKIPIFILMWFLPFFYSISTRLPFIFLALEIQTEERGGELWQVGVILGTYQTCRAIANLLIATFGGKDPFKRLEIVMISLGLFGWLFSAIHRSTSVWALFALCGVGLSETVVNLQRSIILETERESPTGLVDEGVVANRLGLQYAAISVGSAIAYIGGGAAYTRGGFRLTCWFGVLCHVLQLAGALTYLCLARIGKRMSREQDLLGGDLFRYAIYQLQAKFAIASHADDVSRGASNALTFEPQGLTIAAKKAKGDLLLTRALRDMFHDTFSKNEDAEKSMTKMLDKIKSSGMVGLKQDNSRRAAALAVRRKDVAKILVYLMKNKGETKINEKTFISYWGPRVYLSMYESAQESTIAVVWPYMKVVIATQAIMALCIGTFLSSALLSYTYRFNMEADAVGLLLGIGEFLGMMLILLRKVLPPLLSKIELCKTSPSGALGALFARPLHVPFVLILVSIATTGFTIPHVVAAVAFQMLMSTLNDFSVALLVELTGCSLPVDQFNYYQGLGQWLRRLGNMITGVFGPILFAYNGSLPFLLFGSIVCVWSLVVWRMMYLHAKKMELSNNENDDDQKPPRVNCLCASDAFAPFIETTKTPWHILEHRYYSLNKEEIEEALNPLETAQAEMNSLDLRLRRMAAALKVEQAERRALEERIYEHLPGDDLEDPKIHDVEDQEIHVC